MAYVLTADDVEKLFCLALLNTGLDTTASILEKYNTYKDSDVLAILDGIDKGTRVEDNKKPRGTITPIISKDITAGDMVFVSTDNVNWSDDYYEYVIHEARGHRVKEHSNSVRNRTFIFDYVKKKEHRLIKRKMKNAIQREE